MKLTQALLKVAVISNVRMTESTNLDAISLVEKWCSPQNSSRGIFHTPDDEILEAFVGQDNIVEKVRLHAIVGIYSNANHSWFSRTIVIQLLTVLTNTNL